MITDSTALPWFPLTPGYVDRYSDGVLKYVRDNSADTSWGTTVRLILERAGIIMSERLSGSLIETKSKGRSVMILEATIVVSENNMIAAESMYHPYHFEMYQS